MQIYQTELIITTVEWYKVYNRAGIPPVTRRIDGALWKGEIHSFISLNFEKFMIIRSNINSVEISPVSCFSIYKTNKMFFVSEKKDKSFNMIDYSFLGIDCFQIFTLKRKKTQC